ncbi:MAG TPA: S41 family peptidase [Planctomycetota bacterium]
MAGTRRAWAWTSAALGLLLLAAPSAAQADYVADVRFAIEEVEKQCGTLLASKKIDWKKVTAPLLADAEAVRTPEEHWRLLTRLLARLEDGHAEVQKGPAAGDVQWPADPKGEKTGPGMFWCRSGGKLYVKNVWNDSERIGIQPGMEVVEVGGLSAAKWLEQRIAELSDTISFSTPQHAFFFATHWGLSDYPGTKLPLVLKKPKGKKTERELVYGRATPVPWGPAFPPSGLKAAREGKDDVTYGFTEKKYGYIHLRRCPGDLPELVDVALAEVGEAKGLIVDFRANGGGGFDHDAFMGRFVPAGKVFSSGHDFVGAGPNPYGGPVVAIIDGNTRSAGETAAGLFKDDGRGYVIGESPTAGMSSQKTTIELPSKLFSLYVSTASNKGRYNDGKGLEGVGVIPHRIVEYDPQDLDEKVDTLIVTAEQILAKFPQKDVRYDPRDHGWKP